MSILDNLKSEFAKALIPMQVTLELTFQCNERCGHCYLATYDDKADGRPPLRLPEWRRILDELAEAKALYLVLIGGEAMLHPHFWDIAEYGVAKSFAVSLITNGLLLDDKKADRMAATGFYDVTFSLYSLRAGVHDRMTRRFGSHAATMAAIERLQKRGISLGLNCLLTRENIDDCFELKQWADDRKIKIRFDPLVTAKSDSTTGNTGTRATPEQIRRYYGELKKRGEGPMPNPTVGAEDPVCNAGRGKCAVNPYGDLLTCLEVREPIGNLREESFHALWNSPRAERLRGYKNRDLKFDPNCGDGAFCDHCPGMAGAETGDRMSPVAFLMEVARIKREVYES